MTHNEAFERLKELGGGDKYCSLEYRTVYYDHNDSIAHQINAYIEDVGHVYGKTYQHVITGMEAQLGIGSDEPPEDNTDGDRNNGK